MLTPHLPCPLRPRCRTRVQLVYNSCTTRIELIHTTRHKNKLFLSIRMRALEKSLNINKSSQGQPLTCQIPFVFVTSCTYEFYTSCTRVVHELCTSPAPGPQDVEAISHTHQIHNWQAPRRLAQTVELESSSSDQQIQTWQLMSRALRWLSL